MSFVTAVPSRMRAVLKQGRSVQLSWVAVPEPGPWDVLVRVEVAGVCRTDIYVAQGKLPCADPVILGHEFAGVVASVGSEVHGFVPGDRVAAMPAIPCDSCPRCASGMAECCARPQFLGLSRHGAFAEHIAVPAQVVYHLPDSLSFREGAYAEPVCASLAVLKAGIQPGERGLVFGDNRIAGLTKRVLSTVGFPDVEMHGMDESMWLETDAYDFAVETLPTREAFDELIRILRPGGRIILKSRPPNPVEIDLTAALRKELRFEAVSYGKFHQSLEFLARNEIGDLLGNTHPLEDFAEVFAAEEIGEHFKTFLSPGLMHTERFCHSGSVRGRNDHFRRVANAYV
ncbi:zinc-dependent alcohol dehydrogenase [Mycobacterium conspicuum]|jgi:D-arabinose 1-dehydrogenase-like Zn-dependent alcohol dehydrogenase|uniref:Alcohol dehydrogenase n=1 Tax=Mycobacterium conspicuum TaxID=44010 RepID=A0A7I7YMJ9_9MYCO|nr:alcohol dehydrogenase catalytic domain-containing protein [Mycobacterium conspicuum]BBZ42031.1 alcohol dehydrogenase [Mycobacterium conspicuum]